MRQAIKENFRLYLLVIFITIGIVTLGGCSRQPDYLNLNYSMYERLELFCDNQDNDSVEGYGKICDNLRKYYQIDCINIAEGVGIAECEYTAQSYYFEALKYFSLYIK